METERNMSAVVRRSWFLTRSSYGVASSVWKLATQLCLLYADRANRQMAAS
jgi:uncharacterized protein YxjI